MCLFVCWLVDWLVGLIVATRKNSLVRYSWVELGSIKLADKLSCSIEEVIFKDFKTARDNTKVRPE